MNYNAEHAFPCMEKEFWRALFHDWQGILSTSGSVILILLSLVYWDRPVPRWLTVSVGAGCFIFASRRAWMREHNARLLEYDAKVVAEKIIAERDKHIHSLSSAPPPPQRTAAEKHAYDTVRDALKVVKQDGIIALRHLKYQGKFTDGTYRSPSPNGMKPETVV